MAGALKAPAWVTEGYAADAHALRLAIARYNRPVTTPEERQAAQEFVAGETYPCTGCEKFAFPQPTLCYSCRKEVHHGARLN